MERTGRDRDRRNPGDWRRYARALAAEGVKIGRCDLAAPDQSSAKTAKPAAMPSAGSATWATQHCLAPGLTMSEHVEAMSGQTIVVDGGSATH